MLGRAWVFALAANGGAGVSQLLDIFAKEMRVAMALTSVRNVARSIAPILWPLDKEDQHVPSELCSLRVACPRRCWSVCAPAMK